MLLLAWWVFQSACFFVTPLLRGNRNISFQTPKIIRRNAIHGTRITNRYEDILAERINRTQNAAGFTLNDPSGSDAETVLSVGWNFPVAGHFTTGPVMAWRTDGAPPVTVNAFEDTTTTQSLTDPLWHASVNSLGWRVDTQYGDLHPWAKISYNQQTEEEYLYTLGLSAKF